MSDPNNFPDDYEQPEQPKQRHPVRVTLFAAALVLSVGCAYGKFIGADWADADHYHFSVGDDPRPAAPIATPTITVTETVPLSISPSPSISETSLPTPSPSPSATLSASSTPTPKNTVVKSHGVTYYGLKPREIKAMEQCGNTSDRVLLTFDDGGTPQQIQAITDVLQANKVGAEFFVTTTEVEKGTVEKLRHEGFWVGDHTYDHKNLHAMESVKAIAAEIVGGPDSNLFRPPYGATYTQKNGEIGFDNRIKAIGEALGKRLCTWTVDTNDWRGRSAEQITGTVLSDAQPGSVVLMHMHGKHTAEALQPMIDGLRHKGLGLCALSSEPTTKDVPTELPCGN